VATAVKVAQTLKAQMSMVKKKFLGIMIDVHHTVREKKKKILDFIQSHMGTTNHRRIDGTAFRISMNIGYA
jgi:hypothetical protein